MVPIEFQRFNLFLHFPPSFRQGPRSFAEEELGFCQSGHWEKYLKVDRRQTRKITDLWSELTVLEMGGVVGRFLM